MKLSEIKKHLGELNQIGFKLPDGTLVPRHFHVTEIGKISKKFIDCGGTLRDEEVVNFQLWEAQDYDHRLHPEKLMSIIELSERVLELEDLEIEVEYQGNTIGRYDLGFDGKHFLLLNKQTACLALDQCGVDDNSKPKIAKFEPSSSAACEPGSGCC
ncbi:DUF6428 family protein [Autumnicola edwardsiae]|uniref:DUF6428 family protein n=1 Tax=Autumnicola edwardsiae TaxID=3075594 RepID=A0ABU3CR55_9FLAO|nr:DUF6428 family protein [Zunongwangia sp. F297]MDT0648825.1 DUF6428 family protein [Zunongwangia sp. F297]